MPHVAEERAPRRGRGHVERHAGERHRPPVALPHRGWQQGGQLEHDRRAARLNSQGDCAATGHSSVVRGQQLSLWPEPPRDQHLSWQRVGGVVRLQHDVPLRLSNRWLSGQRTAQAARLAYSPAMLQLAQATSTLYPTMSTPLCLPHYVAPRIHHPSAVDRRMGTCGQRPATSAPT